MQVNNMPGGHHILEVKIRDRLVVVDPLYDLYFVRPDGRMAGFTDVHDNWAYYKRQTPQGYDMHYSYAGLTYTNWKKVPFVTPVIKSLLDLVIGRKRADAISLRTLFLRKFHFLFVVLMAVFALVLSFTIRRLLQQQRRSRSLMPVPFGPYVTVQPITQLAHA